MATPYVTSLAALYKLKSKNASKLAQSDFLDDATVHAELALKEEQGETRSFVGQVDLLYFAQKLKDANEDTTTATPPTLDAVKGPEKEPDAESAPNIYPLYADFN